MASEKQEALAKIVAEMRQVFNQSWHDIDREYVHDLPDRIEAAVKRECIEAATRAATQGVKLTNEKYANMPIGNTAAMHDALVAVKKLFDGRLMFQPAIRTAHEAVNAALSKPPRNCDLYGGDYKMLHTAWFDWTGSPSGQNPDGTIKLTFSEWLLEKAVRHDI